MPSPPFAGPESVLRYLGRYTQESLCEEVLRLTGLDLSACPACGEGRIVKIAEVEKLDGPTLSIELLDSS